MKCVFNCFANFIFGLSDFLLLSLQSSLYILDYMSLVKHIICKYFLPVCVLSFHFLNSVFQRADFLRHFGKVNLFSFSLTHDSFHVILRNPCLTQGYKGFFPRLISTGFINLCFAFRSVIHFGWNFVYDARCRSRFFSSHVDDQLFWCHLLKKLSFVHWNSLCICIESKLAIHVGIYFWTPICLTNPVFHQDRTALITVAL